MAEETILYKFSLPELAQALIVRQSLHEGLWGIAIQFGLGAGNVQAADDPSKFVPAAFLPIVGIGLQSFPKPVPGITVDAAEVNPLRPGLPLEGQ